VHVAIRPRALQVRSTPNPLVMVQFLCECECRSQRMAQLPGSPMDRDLSGWTFLRAPPGVSVN